MNDSFRNELDSFARARRSGLLLGSLLFGVAVLFLLGWVFGVGDFFFAWSEPVRVLLFCMLSAVLIGTVLCAIWIAYREGDTALASQVDDITESDRREVSAVQSLLVQKEVDVNSLGGFLEARLREEATQKLERLTGNQRWPVSFLSKALLVLLAVSGLLAGSYFWNQEAFKTVAARLISPWEERLPWSPLKFQVGPETPEVFYGGDVVLRVSITGGEIEDDVQCLVRRPSGKVSEFGVFSDGGKGKFARSLEQVVEPLEVAFTVGKARSEWTLVTPLLRPQITGAKVKVVPPAYSGLPESEFALEGNELRVLAGSTVRLQINSNRPLGGGDLTVTAPSNEGEAQGKELASVSGEPIANQTSEFVWQAERSGQVQAYLTDIRGTVSAEALELNLRVQEDAAPDLDLVSPPPLLLATPKSKLSLQGEVVDDLGLAKVELVRALAGFPERRETIASLSTGKDYLFKESLSLADLGVEPGEILEFYAEATDRNPSLLGLGSSTVSKIQIISEEDYAQRIRDQTTLREFAERYNRLAQAVEESREALDSLEKATESDDKKEFDQAKKKFEEETAKAREEAQRLAEDFPAFELEKDLGEVAKKLVEALDQNLTEARKMSPADAQAAIERMRERLGGATKEAEALQEEAELAKAFGGIAEMAAKFRRVQETQQSIEQRILVIVKEVNKGILRNTSQLEGLAEVQERNRKELTEIAKELKKRNEALPDELTDLRVAVVDFLTRYQILEIPSAMAGTRDAGKRGESVQAWQQAQLSRQLLEQLLGPENAFSQMAQGNGLPGSCRCNCAGTMQQLLEALMAQRGGEGQSGAGGAGGGIGGTGRDGSAAPGHSMVDIPMIGPNRMSFEPQAMAGAGGEGQSGVQPGLKQASEQESLQAEEEEESRFGEKSERPVPEKYREAVKNYFSNEQS